MTTQPQKTTYGTSTYDQNEFRSRLDSLLSPLIDPFKQSASTPFPSVSVRYTPYVAPSVSPVVNTPAPLMQSKYVAPTPTPTQTPTPAVKTNPTPAPTPLAPVQTPTPQAGGSYVVKSGDNLSAIAQRNGMSLQQLLALNPNITNPNVIQIGQSIKLSGSPTSSPTPAPVQTQTLILTAPVKTPEQMANEQNTVLAEQLGKAGISMDQYNALFGKVSSEERKNIANDLGISELEASVFAKPKKSTEALYTEAYTTAGLADVKNKINALNDEISRDREDLRDAVGNIDENPFLTETSRVGRGKRVLDQAEQKISNKLLQVQRYTDLYNTGVNEINNMIGRVQTDFSQDQDLNTAKLNYLLKKMEVNVGDLIGDKKTQYLSSYLKGLTSTKAPDLVGNAETGFYKYDGTTGRFVQVIGKSDKTLLEQEKLKLDIQDKKNGGSDGVYKPTAEQKALVGRFVSTDEGKQLNNGQPFTSAQIAEIMADPAVFFALLQKASESGLY